MIKFKVFKPIRLDDDKEYWLYPTCLGCLHTLDGKGLEIAGAWMHINIFCIIKSWYYHWKMKTRNYD